MSRSALRSYTLLSKSGVAPAPFGGLGEPLLSKDIENNNNNNNNNNEEEEEESNSSWSLGMILGAIVMGTAG